MASLAGVIIDSQYPGFSLTLVEQCYDDNANYAANLSVPQARAFVVACRLMGRQLATSMGKGGAALTFDRAAIERDRVEAQEWIQRHATDAQGDRPGPNVTYANFSGFDR